VIMKTSLNRLDFAGLPLTAAFVIAPFPQSERHWVTTPATAWKLPHTVARRGRRAMWCGVWGKKSVGVSEAKLVAPISAKSRNGNGTIMVVPESKDGTV
jgi:hypothetical protein